MAEATEKATEKPVDKREELVKQQAEKEKQERKDMYQSGRLTRAGMEKILAGGGSVMVSVPIEGSETETERKIITKKEDLPDESVLSRGNAAASQAALDALDEEEARLHAKRAALQKTHEKTQKADAEAKKADEHRKAEESKAKAQEESAAKVQPGQQPPPRR